MKFRKKPIEIEVVQWDGTDTTVEQIEEWACDKDICLAILDGCIFIDTLEGEMRGDPGDWIIRGVAGELYPCKPAIFEASYEKAGAA